MELFRTVLTPGNWDFRIKYPSSHFFIGSCFSENIGKRIENAKFNSCLNPWGILFHPLAIARVLERLIENKRYSEKDLRFEDGRYISFDHHGSFNHHDKKKVLSHINKRFEEARKFLIRAEFIYITWGTSIAYFHVDENEKAVSNCHKIPSFHFHKANSSSAQIVAEYQNLLKKLKSFNPELKIIFSVSPVKHLKDGIVENVRSKARLIEAAHELCESGENRYYFPSFELVQEDLRDYRFYTKDMAHPSEQAIEYIWQYFQNSLWDDETKIISQKISNLQKSFNHRILHPENEQYKSFVAHTLKKAMELEQAHPFINFDKEKCEMMKDND